MRASFFNFLFSAAVTKTGGWTTSLLPSQIAQKILKLQIEARSVNAGHLMAFKYRISFATDLAANVGWNRFRIMPDIVSKLLRAAIWSRCAVRFESEQTTFPWTGHISFTTDLAANFGCDRFRIMPDIVSNLLRAASWRRCAVQFESEQTPFLGQVVDLDLMLCTGFSSEHAVLFLCHIFTQRPMNDRKIERSNGHGFCRQIVGNNF